MPIFKSIFRISLCCLLAVGLYSCSEDHPTADRVFRNGNFYTVDGNKPKAQAVAVTGNRFVAVGSDDEISKWIGEDTEVVDLEGSTVTPGLIESHGHIMGMGWNMINLDLSGAGSYDELVEMVKEKVEEVEPGTWILGRGWHQSKWDPQPEVMVKGFQTHDKLSAVSPDNPVYLGHASGHAGFANAKAMEIAGLNPMSTESMTGQVEGGEIIVDQMGNPTGVFNERAQRLITRYIPDQSAYATEALEMAIQGCLEHGITSFHDAGSGKATMDLIQKFKDEGKLKTRMYVMVTGPDREFTKEWLEKGPMLDTADHLFTVRSIKLNCDGALGSRGAWLLEEYTDRPGHFGHETLPMEYVEEISKKGVQRGFQVCSHAIGDRTNREILDRYQMAFEEFPELATDHRFRIEHAQHLHPDDIPRFAELGVIAAMQAVHLSSDRPWAIDRLGEQRIVEGAYVWQKLLKSGAVVINGTDVPVEPIDPIASFYASVSRKTLKGTPEGGFEPDQRMTREEALKSYTLDAAYGEFAEDVKGSIEVGKLADLTVYDQDLMTVEENKLLDTKVIMTVFDGQVAYKAD